MASQGSGQDLPVGLELGHYRIVEKIGAGGMGEVYRARDEHLARDVAVKVLSPGTLTDASARNHFHKEALALSKLNYPSIATIYDFDTQQGVDFLVMEYIPGITLSEKVAAGPLPESSASERNSQKAWLRPMTTGSFIVTLSLHGNREPAGPSRCGKGLGRSAFRPAVSRPRAPHGAATVEIPIFS